ncbi:hypothetical protein ACFE04_004803 [Oxalis oulophora]
MISILAQERLLGATLGASLTGFIVFEQRRRIFNSISDSDSQFNNKLMVSLPLSGPSSLDLFVTTLMYMVKESIFGKKTRSELAGAWNKAVDETFGPVIEAVSSRGW